MADKRFPGGAANYSVSDFAAAWLKAVGAPVTPQNIAAFNGWANAESSGYNPGSSGGRNNPLNIVATPGDGSVGQGGAQGNIADFPTPEAGVAATAKFFSGVPGAKANIINAFKSNLGPAAVNAQVNSFYGQWGGHINFASGSNLVDTVVGATGSAAQLTGSTVADAWHTITAPVDFLKAIVANWKFFAEVALGILVALVGAGVILADTTRKVAV